jgi:hypothetical protein
MDVACYNASVRATLLVCLLATAATAAPLDDQIARIVAAYGGKAALGRVKAFRETGSLDSRQGSAHTVRLFAPPDRLRVDIDYSSGENEVRILEGPHGFRNGEIVAGPARDAMLLQAARLEIPGILLRKRKDLVDLGEVQRDGRKLRAIGVPLESGINLAVAIDPRTSRIVRSEGALPGHHSQIRFATTYSEFRSVGGVLFPFREENFVEGERTGTTLFERIELLDSVPELHAQ